MRDFDQKTFGERFKAARLEAGLSQAKLGEAIEAEQSRISSIENGEQLPTTRQLILALKVFDKDADLMLFGVHNLSVAEVTASANDSERPVTVAINGGTAHVDVHHHAAEDQEAYGYSPVDMAFLRDWKSLGDVTQMRIWTMVKEEMEKNKPEA